MKRRGDRLHRQSKEKYWMEKGGGKYGGISRDDNDTEKLIHLINYMYCSQPFPNSKGTANAMIIFPSIDTLRMQALCNPSHCPSLPNTSLENVSMCAGRCPLKLYVST